ncbi:hypothetical protein BOX15_Mlig004148g1, partial [Macrostomum lignano]
LTISEQLENHLRPNIIEEVIAEFQSRLLCNGKDLLPDYVANNEALRENVYMMTMCICLRIPLFVVGKPGSSKSLGKTIVKNNMKGENSRGSAFKKLPDTHMLSFQCSPWSTSDGIEKLFQQSAKMQIEKSDPENYVSVVVLDEIGLAEDTPQMSLKVLHSLLEDGVRMDLDGGPSLPGLAHERIGFIGISNWALDPAKMNRGLFVLRDVPTKSDLLKTAKGICKDTIVQESKNLRNLTDFFHLLFNGGRLNCEFFGLRDYFSAVKHLAQKSRDTRLELKDIDVAYCLQRNFSGLEDFDPTHFFFDEILRSDRIFIDSNLIIKDALKATGPDQRYILFITENASGFKVLKRLLAEQDLHILFGSSFPKDQDYSVICLNINRIKQCMERGGTVVLMNLENLYESLYDVLNLCYEKLGQDYFVDIGLGTHRLKSKIHPDFRIIVIADGKTVQDLFPIPLLNRLEKHRLTWRTILEPDMLGFCEKFKEWMNRFLSQEEKGDSALSWSFVGYHDDVIPSLAIDENCDFDSVKRRVLSTATPDSLIRLASTSLSDEKAGILNSYYEENGLGCLASFLNNYKLKKPFLQVTTYDSILGANEQATLSQMPIFKGATYKNISQFETELQFKEFLRKCMTSEGLLILQYEGLQQNQNFQKVVSSVKFNIEEMYLAEKRNMEPTSGKTSSDSTSLQIVLIIKLIRSHSNPFNGLDCGLWHCVHIEELVSSHRINIPMLDRLTVPELFERPIPELPAVGSQELMLGIKAPVNLRLLLQKTLLPALSILREKQGKGNKLTDRNETVSNALKDEDFLQTVRVFLHKALRTMDENSRSIISPENWLSEDAASSRKVKEAGTFIESTWRLLRRKTAPALASFIAFADTDENLANYQREETRALWLKLAPHAAMFDETIENFVKVGPVEQARVEVPSSAADGHHFASQFPFSWAIVKRLEKFEEQSNAGNLSIRDSPMGQALAEEKSSDFLLEAFCHDILHICVSSITSSDVVALQAVLQETVKSVLKEQRKEQTLADTILQAFKSLKKHIEHVNIFVKLTQRIGDLAKNLKKVENFQDLPSELFNAFAKHFEKSRHELNKAQKRKEWLSRVDKSRTIIVRLLAELENPQMQLQWDKINCVALFLRNVTMPFDNEELNESTIKPIRLWNSLWSSAAVKFQDKTGIEEIEKFLEKNREELLEFSMGTDTCSQCTNRTDSLTRLPCNDRLCDQCRDKCIQSAPFVCIKCQTPFDPNTINNEKPDVLVKFKDRCNSFVMEVVSTLCFVEGQPPDSELCNHLLSYVTRSGGDGNVMGYFSNDKDESPMFRSFVLQQLMRYNSDQVVQRLEEHILGADEKVGAESKSELRLILLNCLEDSVAMEQAKNKVVNLSMPRVELPNSESVETVLIPQLQAMAEWRVDLLRLACRLAELATEGTVRNLLSTDDATILIRTLSEHRWSRIYFLRCLCMAGGTCATLQRIQTDPCLAEAYNNELHQMDNGTWAPDLLHSHSEAYRGLKQYLWNLYLTGDFKSETPSAVRDSNAVIALVVATFNFRLQGEVNKKKLSECEKHMLKLMSKGTRECYAQLERLGKTKENEAHKSVLLIHLAYEIHSSSRNSIYAKFLSSLRQNYEKWYLPAMPHDTLFEVMTNVDIGMSKTAAFQCPKGHLYFVGECKLPMETSACPDCGSKIGGTHHRPEDGNEQYTAGDRTSKGFVSTGIPEPVRNLPSCGVALMRMMMGLALQLGNDSNSETGSRKHFKDVGREEFEVGLHLFCDATGRSSEDAFHALHLVLKRLATAGASQSVNRNFDLTKDKDRREFEDEIYRNLLQPIVESLSSELRESNRVMSQDDGARTASNIMRLVHETSSEMEPRQEIGLLWRYRQQISIRSAAHSFTELGGEEQGRYQLVKEVIARQHILKHVDIFQFWLS